MPVDGEAKKIALWADTGDREDPEEHGISRDRGWTADYEQIGSGSEPERTVWNQLMRELTGFAVDRLTMGIATWDSGVSYQHPAFAASVQGLHVSLENTGPNFGNATDPTEAGQTVWRLY